MSQNNDHRQMSHKALQVRCRDETNRFKQGDPNHDTRFCLELFRRAFVARDEYAWEIIYAEYLPQVMSWVRRHAAYESANEDVEFFANGAFTRMWHAVSPEKFRESFDSLSGILQYLQLCVAGEIMDRVRKETRLKYEEELDLRTLTDADDTFADAYARRESAAAIIERCRSLLKSENERIVFRDTFEFGLKPRHIFKRHPAQFHSVSEVYRTKENIMGRIGRDDGLTSELISV